MHIKQYILKCQNSFKRILNVCSYLSIYSRETGGSKDTEGEGGGNNPYQGFSIYMKFSLF